MSGRVAAALVTPGARVSGAAAVILHNLSLLAVPERACVGVLRWLTGSVPGTHLHRSSPARTDRFGAFSCDLAPRAIAEVTREHGVAAGVVTLDHALRVGSVDLAAMQSEAAEMRGWPGSRRLTRAMELADGLSESVLETRSRLGMAAHGVPAPELQVVLGNSWGGFVGRCDFYWDEYGVVGEVDGAVKYDGSQPRSLLHEKQRQERLEQLGLVVVRWDKTGIDGFERTAIRLRKAMTRASALRSATPSGAGARSWTVLPRMDLPIGGSHG